MVKQRWKNDGKMMRKVRHHWKLLRKSDEYEENMEILVGKKSRAGSRMGSADSGVSENEQNPCGNSFVRKFHLEYGKKNQTEHLNSGNRSISVSSDTYIEGNLDPTWQLESNKS